MSSRVVDGETNSGVGDGAKPRKARPAAGHWLTTLDALRGLAALYVVCCHARILLFISRKDAARPEVSAAVKGATAALSAFTFGHQAVVFFFVLSGFCIHFRQAERLREGREAAAATFRFDVANYIRRRVRRIAPPFYFALLFTAIVDWATRLANPRFFEEVTDNPFVNELLYQNNDPLTLLGNLAFLQSLACWTYGNNTALWSLAYEFYLYLLYPIFLALRRRMGVWKGVAVVLAASSACIAVNSAYQPANHWTWPLAVIAYWFSWVIGAAAAELYESGAPLPRPLRSPLVGWVLAASWLATCRSLPIVVSDTFGSLACAHLMLSALGRFAGRRHPRALTWLGRFSYSLYLVHIPVLVAFAAVWFRTHDRMPTQPLPFAAGIVASVAAGWCAYHLVEKRFLSRAAPSVKPQRISNL